MLNGGRYHVEIAADTTVSTTRYYSIAGQRPAMRNNDGSINYLLGDHLGSVSTVVDASGQIISQSRYLPFGEVLWEDGASPTDYTYTGQRSLSDIGLMDYNARFYDPMLGRFTSPDSIVPDPGSVIGYNRFAYVVNNPMIFSDPSGHCYTSSGAWIPGGGDGDCSFRTSTEDTNNGGIVGGVVTNTDTDGDGISDKASSEEGLISHPDHTCEEDNLVECFYTGGYWPNGDYTFTEEEWNDFTWALYQDICKRANGEEGFWTLKFFGRLPGDGRGRGERGARKKGRDSGDLSYYWFVPFHTTTYHSRQYYDTPLFNGYDSSSNEPPPYVGNICIENRGCYDRNDVNYVAQGMWSAAASEGKGTVKAIAHGWKIVNYGHTANTDTIYWAQQGVAIYNLYDNP